MTGADKASEGKSCVCAICKTHLDFELDAHLLSEIERHNCVIFAGAGVSTETRLAHPDTFYETIASQVANGEGLSFPSLMSLFERQPNGRQKLIQEIADRFAYIDSFRDARRFATRFHRAIGTMPYFKVMVTTNWDRYFEQYAGATPFVYESDVPFWESASRAVLKIHGSIDNYTSIVATEEDYNRCEARLPDGAIGAVLKQIFATKTIIFFGYSLKDQDFLNVYQTIQGGLSSLKRTHYVVSPFTDESDAARLADLSMVPVKTDATYFLDIIKDHMCSKFCFAKDETFDKVSDLLHVVYKEHFWFTESFRAVKNPHLIYAAFYQDGLIHALERIIDQRHTGEYSDLHHVQNLLRGYDEKIESNMSSRRYDDVAYFTGYLNGLLSFLMYNNYEEAQSDLPLYFHPGAGEINGRAEYDATIRSNPTFHKTALKEAVRMVKRQGIDETVVVQHMPWG